MQKTDFDEVHYLILERLSDRKVHFPFREPRMYDSPVSRNVIMEKICQMQDKDLPLVVACGGDSYFHAKITPIGYRIFQELRVSREVNFTNPETYAAASSDEAKTPEGIEASKNLHDLSRKLGI
jgi:hypothetical protein